MEKTYNFPMEGMDLFYALNVLVQIVTIAYYLAIPILLYKIYKILKDRNKKL